MAENRTWMVTTSPEKLSAVVKALPEAGFQVEHTLDELGVIVGHGDDASAELARAIDGVDDVSSDLPIDIGTPGSPNTW